MGEPKRVGPAERVPCGGSCGWRDRATIEKPYTFECPWCERDVCYCMGAYDDTPALCNDCALKLGAWAEDLTGEDHRLGARTVKGERDG